MNSILVDLGFELHESTDQTAGGIIFFDNLISRISQSSMPNLSLKLLMGDTTKLKIANLLKHLKNGNLELASGVYIKKDELPAR